MKQVCVIGLGQFGMRLSRELTALGCEVLAIDINEALVTEIRDHVHQAVIADARQFDALAEVVSKDMDEAIVTPGESLETSILCTLHLRNIGVKTIRVKAADDDHAAILKALGIKHIITPEGEMAARMAQRIMHPDLLDYLPLSPAYQVVEIEVPEGFVGKSLAALHLRREYNVLAVAIKGPEPSQIRFLPAAESVLHRGESMIVLGRIEDIEKLSS